MPLTDMLAGDRFVQGYDSSRQRGMGEMQQALTLSGLIEQQRMRQMQAQEAQRKAAEAQAYRSAMGALPPGTTEEDMLRVARPYQSPDQIGTQITASRDRQLKIQQHVMEVKAQMEAKVQAANQALAAKLEMAQQQGADRRTLMQMQLEGRKEIAGMMAGVQRESIAARRDAMQQGNKPPIGYRATADGNLEAIPGGPADAKLKGKEEGRGQISQVVDNLAAHYDSLEKMGAVITPKQSTVKNAWERTAASGPGQMVAGFAGTKAQSVRDQISNSKPLLMAAIKQASGMSSQQLNSNAELQFYLQAATDPNRSLEANRAALAVLDQTYGMGTGVKANKASIDAIRSTAPKTQAQGGIKFLGFE